MALKQQLKQILRRIFEVGQRFKVDILPRHFYSEIPSIPLLRSTTAWRRPLSMDRIAGADLPSQLAFTAACTEGMQPSLSATFLHQRACEMNGLKEGFGPIEADFLYCFVRSHRPPQIVQVGCGVSTAVCILAAADEGYKPESLCIEPYPTPFLVQQAAAGVIRLVAKKVEECDVKIGEILKPGGLFFVDSTHTLGPAGEVTQLICETLPTPPAGAWAHFHDIHFPYDYSPEILTSELFFSHETALLYAFLLMNSAYSIAVSLSMLHHSSPAELARLLPRYRPAQFDQGLRLTNGHHPSSIYLRVGESSLHA
jgi:hypothetical protein